MENTDAAKEPGKTTSSFKKWNWKEILAIVFILVAIYFFWSERKELRSLGASLRNTDMFWLVVGIVLTIVYILLQAALYVYSFLSIGGKISWPSAIDLFLKRNVIAVFLPGGGLTALAYLPSSIKESQQDRQKVHHASVIFGFIGIFSVFIVAVPVLLYLSIIQAKVPGTTAGLLTIVAMLTAMALFVRSVQKKGPFYRWAIKGRPKLEKFLNEIFAFDLHMKQFWNAVIVSVLIEVVGVAHLYISMLATGVEPSMVASIVGYIVATIFLIISPFLRGMGAIEVSLTFILTKYGYTTVQSFQIALLFRFFEFWLPLLAGLIYYLDKGRQVVFRLFPNNKSRAKSN
jgi:phosphatidylglycerol lysyltransferase